MKRNRSILTWMAAVIITGCAILAVTTTVTADEDKAAAILERYVEVTGGQDVYDNLKNQYAMVKLDMPSMGLSLNVEVWIRKDDRFLSVVSSDALGEIRRGWDGSTFWENSMMSGPRIIEGEELVQAEREATLEKYVFWKDVFESASYAGEEMLDSVMCDKLIMTPASGDPTTLFVDQKTGFVMAEQSVINHQMGKVPVMTRLSDYREVDGIMVPHETMMDVMGQVRTMTVQKVAYNIDMPDSLFALPQDIIDLKAAAEEAEAEG